MPDQRLEYLENPNNISNFRRWMVAIRPFALSASSMPVIFGTTVAVVVGNAHFNLPLFLLSLLAMMTLHSGANMVNDVSDYQKGLDKLPTPGSGAIVRELLTVKQVSIGAVSLLIVGSLIGLVIAWRVGWPVFYIGLAGLIMGVSYTLKPLALKYRGLGDFVVFLNFGLLGALGAWTVQTGRISWLPVVWAVPMSMLVVAILHANNWRDISSDGCANVVTMASRLGDRGSLIYYGFLVFGSFVVTVAFVAFSVMPMSFLISWLAFPRAIALWRRALNRSSPKRPLDFITMDAATAQLNLIFGLLSTAALILYSAISSHR